jgi:hypothetical protein
MASGELGLASMNANSISVPQSDGCVAIQSVHCGNWLRMDGENVTDNGGGVVNCQSFVGFMEKFYIGML